MRSDKKIVILNSEQTLTFMAFDRIFRAFVNGTGHGCQVEIEEISYDEKMTATVINPRKEYVIPRSVVWKVVIARYLDDIEKITTVVSKLYENK